MPAGTAAKMIQLLTAGASVPVQQRGDTINLTVPSVEVHEVVAIDLS
jgi:hypothetical protein